MATLRLGFLIALEFLYLLWGRSRPVFDDDAYTWRYHRELSWLFQAAAVLMSRLFLRYVMLLQRPYSVTKN